MEDADELIGPELLDLPPEVLDAMGPGERLAFALALGEQVPNEVRKAASELRPDAGKARSERRRKST